MEARTTTYVAFSIYRVIHLRVEGMFEVFGVVVIGLLMRILPAWLFLTAAHGHGALMGVYAMLAIALALFSLRNIVDARYWKEKWLMVSFWA